MGSAQATLVAEFRAQWPRGHSGLACLVRAPLGRHGQPQPQSRADSYLVLLHAPHQFFGLSPQVSAQRGWVERRSVRYDLAQGWKRDPRPSPGASL